MNFISLFSLSHELQISRDTILKICKENNIRIYRKPFREAGIKYEVKKEDVKKIKQKIIEKYGSANYRAERWKDFLEELRRRRKEKSQTKSL